MGNYQPWRDESPPSRMERQLREELAQAIEVVREQGEFIQKMKRDIRDFLVGDEPVKMQRSIADQGFRVVPSGSERRV